MPDFVGIGQDIDDRHPFSDGDLQLLAMFRPALDQNLTVHTGEGAIVGHTRCRDEYVPNNITNLFVEILERKIHKI